MNRNSPAALLTTQVFQFSAEGKYGSHPAKTAPEYYCRQAEACSEAENGGIDFRRNESIYSSGVQWLRLSEIPKLQENLRVLTRLGLGEPVEGNALRSFAGKYGGFYAISD